MFRNYIQIALRTLKRKPGYAFINVFGLAVGMAAFFAISLFLSEELSSIGIPISLQISLIEAFCPPSENCIGASDGTDVEISPQSFHV